MNPTPRATWIAAIATGLLGLSALVVGATGEEQTPTIVAGVILLICTAGLFFARLVALVTAGVFSVILLARYAPGVLNPAEHPGSPGGMVVTVGSVLVLLMAVSLLGGLSASSGGC